MAPAARAQTPAHPRSLRWDPAWDVSVTAAGAAAWVTSQAFEPELAPSSCRWCDVDGLDESVRRDLVWSDTAGANTASNVIAFGVAPLAALGLDAIAAGHDGALGVVPVDALIVGEATIVAVDLSQVVKFTSGRERPFVHALAADQKPRTANPADNDVSFFSGHTTATFALAAAAGTVATMRGYRWAPIVWAAGAALAAATGYLRIAADEHWLTDVLTGAAVGAGVGFGVPYLLHRPDEAGAALDDARTAGASRPPDAPARLTVAPVAAAGPGVSLTLIW
jgi:membrane-associated phospholipid phosphatase